MASMNGVPLFNALWTCMDSRYIRAQALTLTKAHDERNGPLKGFSDSIERYGYEFPPIAYSDDPVKDKGMLCANFPTLAENLTPMAAAHGLQPLSLPSTTTITYLGSIQLVESALLTVLAPLEDRTDAHLCISVDAEWNVSRTEGVSVLQIAPHSTPNNIYIIPVRPHTKSDIFVPNKQPLFRSTGSKIIYHHLFYAYLFRNKSLKSDQT